MCTNPMFRPLRNLEKFLLKDTFIFIKAVSVHQYNFITWLFLVSDLFFHFSTCCIICTPRLYLYFSINPKCLYQYLIQDRILHMVVVYLNLSHTWSFLTNIVFFFFLKKPDLVSCRKFHLLNFSGFFFVFFLLLLLFFLFYLWYFLNLFLHYLYFLWTESCINRFALVVYVISIRNIEYLHYH